MAKKKVEIIVRPKLTRSQAIRANCLECMGFDKREIRFCPAESCPLWPFRMGSGQEETDVPLKEGHYK